MKVVNNKQKYVFGLTEDMLRDIYASASNPLEFAEKLQEICDKNRLFTRPYFRKARIQPFTLKDGSTQSRVFITINKNKWVAPANTEIKPGSVVCYTDRCVDISTFVPQSCHKDYATGNLIPSCPNGGLGRPYQMFFFNLDEDFKYKITKEEIWKTEKYLQHFG